MPVLRLDSFGGMIPGIDARLLPEKIGARVVNTWPYTGTLQGLRKPKQIHVLNDPDATQVYRVPFDRAFVGINDGADWLEFSSPDTTVVHSQVIDDQFERYYWASPDDVPRYNTRERIHNGDPAWKLGVNPPLAAPGVTITGGTSDVLSSRAYVVTWVTAYGEESPPSSPTVVVGKSDAVFTISLPAVDSDDLGVNRLLSKARIYRTLTGTDANATYFLVIELDIANTTWDDTATDDVVARNAELNSTTWYPPPDDLQGIFAMANGMLVGFRKNELWFCEPFRPHSWPPQYTTTVDFPIVGLGTSGQTVVAATSSHPNIGMGVNPSAMAFSALRRAEPCTSRGSIVSSENGVFYSSPNGLIMIARDGSFANVTQGLANKPTWNEWLPLYSLRCAGLTPSAYFCAGSKAAGGSDDDATKGGLIDVQTSNPTPIGLVEQVFDIPIVNVTLDQWTGNVFLIYDGKVWYYDLADQDPELGAYLWRTKVYQTPFKDNFSVARIFFDVPANTTLQDTEITLGSPQELEEDQYGLFRAYADDVLIMTREIRTSGELIRLPSGFKSDAWQFEFEARVKILNVQIATSVKELRQA